MSHVFFYVVSLWFICVQMTDAYAEKIPFPASDTGDCGLASMPTGRTFGAGTVVYGFKSFSMRREVPVIHENGYCESVQDYPTILALPVTLGLTDEIDITAAYYAYHDVRSLRISHDGTSGYGEPNSGKGVIRSAMKVRLPLSKRTPFQISGTVAAMFDTSDNEVDGLNYPWTHKGTNVELTLAESYDVSHMVSVHFAEGFVLSGSDFYDDQVTTGVGISWAASRRWSFRLEMNSRTFLGVSPSTVLCAADDLNDDGEKPAADTGTSIQSDERFDFLEDRLLVTPSLAFRINEYAVFDCGVHFNVADSPDNREDFQAIVGLTVTSRIMSLIDKDRDGVNDDLDREPMTPRGYPVDQWGRALDTDADGVPDAIDREENTPAGAEVNNYGAGIDTDGDGIYNGLDKEPYSMRGVAVDASGVALDGDKDGVPDTIDRELATVSGAVVDETGVAIDSDSDGVPDGIDRDNSTPIGAMVENTGVAVDSDGDGVPDGIDEEPNTPEKSTVDSKGRDMLKYELHLLREGIVKLQPVYFSLGGTAIDPESIPAVDQVGQLLSKHAELTILIEGHSDSQGSKESIFRIARERADTVADYILDHFPEVNRSQILVVGNGAMKPTAPNDTEEGRRLNRRVEFVVLK